LSKPGKYLLRLAEAEPQAGPTTLFEAACAYRKIGFWKKLTDPLTILNSKNHILLKRKLSIEDESVFISRLKIARQAACGWKMT